jgi:hypothetical protein
MSKKVYSNLPTDSTEVTQQFFEQYFGKNIAISENELSAIVGYFETRTPNKQAAQALSLAVISGAVEQDLKPMEILDQFKKLQQQQLDTYLAYFLNLTRYPTSLVGLTTVPLSNKYVARSILA